MAKGWGYKSNRRSQKEIAVSKLMVTFDSEDMKVYESLNNSLAGGILNIRILFNKQKNTIKAILTGKDMQGQRVLPISQDVTNLKTISNIKKELLDYTVNEFQEHSIGVIENEIENMIDKVFNDQLNKFIEHEAKNMSKESRSQKWNRFYNDMFNRTSLYNDDDIVLMNERYFKAIGI